MTTPPRRLFSRFDARRSWAWQHRTAWALTASLALLSCKRDKVPEPDPAVSAASSSSAQKAEPGKTPAKKTSQAISHLPSNCLAVIRAQWAKLAAHPVLGPHLTAAFEPNAQTPAGPEQAAFLNFLKSANIDPKRDVSQVVVCLLQAQPNRTVAVLGGSLPGDFLGLMKRHAPKGKSFDLQERQGMSFLELQGQYLVQADDHAVLIGSDFDALRSAVSVSETHKNYGIPESGDIAAVLRGELLQSAMNENIKDTPFKDTMPKVERLEVSVNLEQSGSMQLLATMANEQVAKQLEGQFRQLINELEQRAARAPAPVKMMLAPNLALARSARFVAQGKQVKVDLTLPPGMLPGMVGQFLGPVGAPPTSPPMSSARQQVVPLNSK